MRDSLTVIGFARFLVMAITVAAMVLGHLLPVGEHSVLLQNLRNGLHAPAFLLFSAIIWRAARGNAGIDNESKATLVTIAFAVAVAISGETFQHLVGQPFSFKDLTSDLLGCAAAMLYLNRHAICRASISKVGRVMTGSSYVLLALVLLAPGRSALVLIARAEAMPELISPDSSLLRDNFEGQSAVIRAVPRMDEWSPDRGSVLRIEMAAAEYAGIAVVDPYPDWRSYTNLSFRAASGDGRERRLTLRIHDGAHDDSYEDRFNRSWHLGRPVLDGRRQGIDAPRKLCIPLSDIEQAPARRTLALDDIAGMAFFVTDAQAGDVFLLSDVRLERSSGEPCSVGTHP